VARSTTLVLLPGLDGTEIFLRPLLRALPGWIEPLVVTYPARGRNDYAHLFELVHEATAGVRECFVLGWSFSGPLALELAEREPGKVRGVILAATFVRSPQRRLGWFRLAMVGPVVWLFRAARRLPIYLSRSSQRELRRDKWEAWRRVSCWTLAKRARAIVGVDARDRLRRCRAPVLYVAGTRDTVVPHHNSEEIVRELPSTTVAHLEGGHLALYSNPEAAARVLSSWIEEVERRIPVDGHGGGAP
jgi:pimeloyl-ACP methyl ester carboxylesterase